jgi:hypothetical protein
MLLLVGASAASAQTSLTATWDRNTDAHTAGYRVYYGTASGNYQWSVDAGNQLSVPISVSSGNVYYFVVRAYNASFNYGPPSNEVIVDLSSVPAPTAQITATLQSNTTALVTWQTSNAASATINGTAVALSGSTSIAVSAQTTFTLVARAADGRTATASATVTPTVPAPTAQITATLQNNTTALVTWQTSNATSATINGTAVGLSGSQSIAVSAQTTFTLVARAADGRTATASATVTPTVPPAPTAQITATLQNNTTALITWQTANATSAVLNGNAVSLSGSTSVTVSAQTTFTLVARAADGRTATASATVTPTAPAPTAQITATLSDGKANLNWQTTNAVSAAINGTAVDLAGATSVPVSETTTFTITASAADGRTATASATVTVDSATPPGVPLNLRADVSGSRAFLAWQRPASGGTPTHYLLYVGDRSGASNVANAMNVGDVLNVSGQLGRGTYYARVRAANGAGTSFSSNEVRFRIGRKLATPTGFNVTWTGTVATLSWTAPAADTAEDVPANYVLEAGTAPGRNDAAVVRVGNVTTFSADVSYGTYYVRLRAENAYGESDPTEDLEVRAPGSPQPPTRLANYGSGSVVDLRWTASAGGYQPTGYIVEAGSAPGLSDLATLPVGKVTRFVVTAPPGVYYVRVRAINARGPSASSNEIVVRK